MDLSIVIVSWNTSGLLAQCLASVFAHPPGAAFEVVVIDNGSADDSIDMVRANFPQVRLLANASNQGFARANNRAIQGCTGRMVMLLNSDTIVQSGALTRLVRFMDADASAGIAGANLVNQDGSAQWCWGRFPTILSEIAVIWGLNSRAPFSGWLMPRFQDASTVQPVDWVLGAGIVVRRSALDQVGGLDESFFMYSEEVDLAFRIRQRGWKAYLLRDATIVHLGGKSSDQMPAAMKAELLRSKVKFFRKYRGPQAALLLHLTFAVSIFCKRWMYLARGRKEVSDLWRQTWRYYRSNVQMPAAVAA